MKFCSNNEIEKFAYNDCVITGVVKRDSELVLNLEALIVKANNSQNSNFTDSYAGETECKISGITYYKLCKIGFKYYDADDNLISETPDEEMDINSADLDNLMKDMYLYKLEKTDEDGLLHLEFETVEEDISVPTDAYELVFSADNIAISWDRYMNRVQN